MSNLLALTAGLVCAVACEGQSSPSRARDSAVTTQTRAPGPRSGDTAFVELQRVARTNSRTTDGGCHFTSSVDPKPLGFPKGAIYEQRVVSFDRRTCATVVAIGYRLQMPSPDTAGTAGRSDSTSISFADSASPGRRKHQ